MAPEQFTGSDVDPRADIYSLGATVFHVLTGHPPFDGRTVWEVMKKKSWPAPRLAPPVSAETADLVAAMLATEAAGRPADYAELIARIDALPCLDGAFGASGRHSAASAPVIALPPPAPAQTPAPAPAAAPRRKWWVYGAAVVALLGAAVGIALFAGAFNRTPGQKDSGKGEPGAKTYAVGSHELLYRSGSIAGWVPDGGFWKIEQDEEKSPVLSGTGGAIRRFEPPANFRVVLALDPYKATTVDVVIATTGPPATATRWLVRLDRQTGVAFGKRVGSGAFEPLDNAVPLPTPQELVAGSKRPYLEVRYERAGGTLTAWFQNQQLGSTPDTGLVTTEFRVQATGGAIRIDYAALESLVEQE